MSQRAKEPFVRHVVLDAWSRCLGNGFGKQLPIATKEGIQRMRQ